MKQRLIHIANTLLLQQVKELPDRFIQHLMQHLLPLITSENELQNIAVAIDQAMERPHTTTNYKKLMLYFVDNMLHKVLPPLMPHADMTIYLESLPTITKAIKNVGALTDSWLNVCNVATEDSLDTQSHSYRVVHTILDILNNMEPSWMAGMAQQACGYLGHLQVCKVQPQLGALIVHLLGPSFQGVTRFRSKQELEIDASFVLGALQSSIFDPSEDVVLSFILGRGGVYFMCSRSVTLEELARIHKRWVGDTFKPVTFRGQPALFWVRAR